MEVNSNGHETTLDGPVFTGEIDRFKGVTVTSKDEAQLNREELSEKLKKSIKKWKHEVIASINNIILFQINFFMVIFLYSTLISRFTFVLHSNFYFLKDLRTIWFNVSLSESEWIPVLSEEFGFEVHHAKPPSIIVMMKWISEIETNQVLELKLKLSGRFTIITSAFYIVQN